MLLVLSFNADAALLINCSAGTSGFGQMVWIGTYRDINGQVFRMMFPMGQYTYCPNMV